MRSLGVELALSFAVLMGASIVSIQLRREGGAALAPASRRNQI